MYYQRPQSSALNILGVLLFFGVAVVIVLVLFVHFVLGRIGNSFSGEPRTFREYNLRGNQFYQQGAYKRAVSDYTHMIELEPNLNDGYLLRGMAYYKLGDYNRSVADDTKAIGLATIPLVRADLYYNRGLGYKGMNRWDEAIADFGTSIQYRPENYDAYEGRAWCYMEKGENDKAIRDYSVSLSHTPNDGNTLMLRGQVYVRKGDNTHAISDLSRSIAIHPNYPPTYALRAEAYDHTGNYAKAAADYAKAAKLEPQNAGYRGDVGWYQYLDGKLPDAIANTKQALGMNPSLTYARFNLGLCYATQGDWNTAETEYRIALQQAKPADLKGALQDVKDALKKQPHSSALNNALSLLSHSNAN
ncbi:MAG TPA: tetratricopeptide repeat protein [Chthonomonadaceae bacterium]|nr:tetratricopeptide repeat protein [Chthonomonadaceae bacterium]